MSNVKIHTKKDTIWTNASGDQVPVKFVPKTDKLKEAYAGNIHQSALKVEKALLELYHLMSEATKEISDIVREEYSLKKSKGSKPWKGGVTWYNFDKSIKIEADINEILKWDHALMTEAFILFNEWCDSSLSEDRTLIRNILNSLMGNAKGMIDSRKVFSLLKWENDVKSVKYSKACELIKKAQSIDRSKLYMRVWERAENGEYRNINLNFSSI